MFFNSSINEFNGNITFGTDLFKNNSDDYYFQFIPNITTIPQSEL